MNGSNEMNCCSRDHSVHALSQWETTLHCNVVSLTGRMHKMIPAVGANNTIHCWNQEAWYSVACFHSFINTLRPRQNGRHFADNIFKCIFLNENARISIKFSLKFVPKGPINKIPTLVQIMAWRRSGDKPLSEPMMVSLLAHICVTRPQWVKTYFHNDAVYNLFAGSAVLCFCTVSNGFW